MLKLVIVTVSNPVISDIIKAKSVIEEKYGNLLDLKLFYVGSKVSPDSLKEIENSIVESNFIILDLMGSSPEIGKTCFNSCKHYNKNLVIIGNGERYKLNTVSRLGEFLVKEHPSQIEAIEVTESYENTELVNNKDIRSYIYIRQYWKNAGVEEILNMLYLILRDYQNHKEIKEPQPPVKPKPISICDPSNMKRFLDLDDYIKQGYINYEKPTVAILYYGNSGPNRTQDQIGKISDRISQFANVIPIAFTSYGRRHLSEVENILLSPNSPKLDIILNFMAFRLASGPMREESQHDLDLLKKLNVPCIHPFFMAKREIAEWEASDKGISTGEFLTTVMLPELDGSIEMYPVGGIKNNSFNKQYNVEIIELDIIEDRVEKLIGRVKKWINLRHKQNKEKKVAIICYNYPPSEGNIFGGAFLNTFESVENILSTLKNESYSVDSISKEDLMGYFTAGKIVNSGKWSTEDTSKHMIKYSSINYISEIKNVVNYKDTCETWREAPGNIMVEGNDFLIPGKIFQNVFVGLQPTRGIHENPEKAYHDRFLPPHHQYQAYYKWLKEEFEADIIVHVGTHGTLEFLKGKECGMSSDCYPDIMVYDMPHAYIYNITNSAESSIAKRRSHAVMISYQPPNFTEGELYGDLILIESLINEYHVAEQTDETKCKDIFSNIKEKAKELNIPAENLDELENELYRMKRSLIPCGLHTFGKGYNVEEAINFMKFVLRYDRAETKSLKRLICEQEGLDYDEELKQNNVELLKRLDIFSNEIIDNFIDKGEVDSCYLDALNFGKQCMEAVRNCNEMNGLLKVLNGEYLPAKMSGDVFRNPEVLPTGYNMYQFDPYSVPTAVAYERGKNIAENTLEKYKAETGQYPKSVAIVLWGIETSRTQGETLGQILNYLGVKIGNNKNKFNFQYEIIPIEKLNHPRIDITIDMSGFFRDMYPNMVDELNNIFRDIYSLDEPDDFNYFKANSKKIYDSLINNGYEKEEAEELSYSRLFGPREGEYGNGVNKLIETRNWKDESQLGNLFIQNTGNIYTKNYRGKRIEGLFNEMLSKVDLVTQIRSYHGYEVTDLDDFYTHFGGMAKAVEVSKGEKVKIYINDTTGEKIETDNVQNSIARGVRTRLLNPKWIDGMLENKYHGAQKIEKIFENIIGLASTTNEVEGWIFDNLHSTYISDETMKERMKDNNKWAYSDIIERMIEAKERGYWNATEEQYKELCKAYIETEGSIEEDI